MTTPSIRNIHQTAQERVVVKTAPDMIVYLDGIPYLFNPYLGTTGEVINFNDYVTAVTGGCDVENLIPTASISLSVPIAFKNMFMAPGGEKLIKTMEFVQIYGKGYYLEPDGSARYHRVFYGLTDRVSYNDTKQTMEITISCKGICRFLELSQTVDAPGALSFNDIMVTPWVSRKHAKSPYQVIEIALVDDLAAALFKKYSVYVDEKISGDKSDQEVKDFLRNDFVTRWAPVLADIVELTKLYGYKLPTRQDIYTKYLTTKKKEEKTTNSGEGGQAQGDPVTKGRDVYDLDYVKNNILMEEIRKWHPFMEIGSINLIEQKTTSRIEHVRDMLSLMGYEGYQDLDGQIIMKPPLYNLDVTNTTMINNPFIINIDEIDNESEDEDEGAIRATRMSVQGQNNLGISGPLLDNEGELNTTTSFVDLKLLGKFGLREEGVKQIQMISSGSTTALFACAVSELVKMNRGYKTYTCSIPFRPELRLGFPIYIPHHDMYAYIRAISWSYNVGGSAGMTLTCDSVRKRQLYKVTHTKVTDGKQEKEEIYQAVPNLATARLNKNDKSEYSYETVVLNKNKSTSDQGNTVALPSATTETEEYKALRDASMRLKYETKAPGKNSVYKVIKEDPGFPVPYSYKGKDRVSVRDNSKLVSDVVDIFYMKKLQSVQPLTDEQGYEVLSPFPWGRWGSLDDALFAFKGYYPSYLGGNFQPRDGRGNPVNGSIATVEGINRTSPLVGAFLFVALRTPDSAFMKKITEASMKPDKGAAVAQFDNFRIANTFYSTILGDEAQRLIGDRPILGPNDTSFYVEALDPYSSMLNAHSDQEFSDISNSRKSVGEALNGGTTSSDTGSESYSEVMSGNASITKAGVMS